MVPTVEGPSTRVYHIRFKNGDSLAIQAVTICTPDSDNIYYTLKRDEGTIVAQFRGTDVIGWHITEVVNGK